MVEKNERRVQVLPQGVDAEAFLALANREITEQFPSKSITAPQKVEPRPAQQLPDGVSARDITTRSGEQA